MSDGSQAKLQNASNRLAAEGHSFPQVRLQDGTVVQTGTVAALIQNIARYAAGERGTVEDEMRAAIPTVHRAGLFNVFPPEDWASATNPGRAFVGQEAKKFFEERKQAPQ